MEKSISKLRIAERKKVIVKRIEKLEQFLLEGNTNSGLMSIFWTQKVKLFYAALLANNSHCSGVM